MPLCATYGRIIKKSLNPVFKAAERDAIAILECFLRPSDLILMVSFTCSMQRHFVGLVAWHSGRMPVFCRRTFPVLH